MEYTELKKLKISRFGLGTVQFGFDYGINNDSGQVPYSEIVKIFTHAEENGINFIDTSRVYGTSEEMIGKVLKELGTADKFILCTKLDLPAGYEELSEAAVLQAAGESMEKSREMLMLEKLPVYLLHNPDYMKHSGGIIWEFVKEQKAKGVIEHLGVSIGVGPEEAMECLEHPEVDAIQIPFNLFDSRWEKVLEVTSARGIAVFNRSTYLQGLLLMEPDAVQKRLPRALDYSRTLDKITKQAGVDKKRAAIKYVFSEKRIASTIVGVDSFNQLTENLDIYNEDPLSPEFIETARNSFSEVPEAVLNPALWT